MKKSIQKTKNSQNNNLYQSTESIIKIIIDKLIYLSIRKSYSNKIDSQLQDYCFNYMKNNINNMFEPYYISHTLDSKKPINNNENNEKKDELFWKLKKPQNNTWVEILEPQYFEIDRYEGTNIKYKEIKDDDIGSVGRKKIQNIPETKNANKKSHFIYNKNNNDIIKASNKNVKIDFIEKIENIKKISDKNLLISNNIVNKKDNILKEKGVSPTNNNISSKNKNKKINQIAEFSNEEISNLSEDDNKKYDLPNVEILRKEIEESKLRIEEEKRKMKKEDEKENVLQKLINDKKNKKIFDSNRLTFDSDGKIIYFKQYNIDNLKDFALTKNFIKEVKKNDNIKVTKKKLNNNNNQISKTPVKVLKIKEEEIIRQYKNQINRINDRPVEKIIPSGSNFQIMSPDIGVVIKENGQSKEGPKEFSKYFKKYSIKDYDDMLNNYLPKINKKFLKTNFDSMPNRKSLRNNVLNLNNIIKNNQLNLNKIKSNDINNIVNNEDISIYNPLLSSQNKENNLIDKNMNNLSNYKSIDIPNNNMLSSRISLLNNSKNNPLLSSFNNINSSNMNNNNLYTTNLDKFITMKKEGMGSLKLELDSLKDLDDDSGFYKNSLTTRYNDIIGNQFRTKNKSLNPKNEYKNDFGEFNKKILTNRKWGNEINLNNSNSINTVYSKHQTKIQVLRELGSNILDGIKIKLPRNRKVNLSIK